MFALYLVLGENWQKTCNKTLTQITHLQQYEKYKFYIHFFLEKYFSWQENPDIDYSWVDLAEMEIWTSLDLILYIFVDFLFGCEAC